MSNREQSGTIEDAERIIQERQLLAERQNELAKCKQNLSSFQDRLNQFKSQYDAIVLPIYMELDLLRDKIADLKGASEYDKDTDFSNDDIVDEDPNEDGSSDSPSDESRLETAAEVKDLFRQAAKSVHPDLACDDVERDIRTQYMAQINEAYRSGNLEQLQDVVDDFFESALPVADEPFDMELSRVQRILSRVKREIVQTEHKILHLELSHLGKHLESAETALEDGWDYLAALAEELSDELAMAIKEFELLSGEVYTSE